MREALVKVLGSILRSLFISILMLVITLSIVTGKFPPDFGRLKSTWQSLQQIARVGQEFHAKSKALQANSELYDESDAVSELATLQRQRAELGAGLLAGQGPSAGAAHINDSNFEDGTLRTRVQELERQLYQLQQRVGELEKR